MPLDQGGVFGVSVQILNEGDQFWGKSHVLQDSAHPGLGHAVKSLIEINVNSIIRRDIMEF